jgi:hypothetical protein
MGKPPAQFVFSEDRLRELVPLQRDSVPRGLNRRLPERLLDATVRDVYKRTQPA